MTDIVKPAVSVCGSSGNSSSDKDTPKPRRTYENRKLQDGSTKQVLTSPALPNNDSKVSRYGRTRKPKVTDDYCDIDDLFEPEKIKRQYKKKLDVAPTTSDDIIIENIPEDELSIEIPEDNVEVSKVLKIISNKSPQFSPDSSCQPKPLKTYMNRRKQSLFEEEQNYDLPEYPEELECTFDSDSNAEEFVKFDTEKYNELLKLHNIEASDIKEMDLERKSPKKGRIGILQRKNSPRRQQNDIQVQEITPLSDMSRRSPRMGIPQILNKKIVQGPQKIVRVIQQNPVASTSQNNSVLITDEDKQKLIEALTKRVDKNSLESKHTQLTQRYIPKNKIIPEIKKNKIAINILSHEIIPANSPNKILPQVSDADVDFEELISKQTKIDVKSKNKILVANPFAKNRKKIIKTSVNTDDIPMETDLTTNPIDTVLLESNLIPVNLNQLEQDNLTPIDVNNVDISQIEIFQDSVETLNNEIPLVDNLTDLNEENQIPVEDLNKDITVIEVNVVEAVPMDEEIVNTDQDIVNEVENTGQDITNEVDDLGQDGLNEVENDLGQVSLNEVEELNQESLNEVEPELVQESLNEVEPELGQESLNELSDKTEQKDMISDSADVSKNSDGTSQGETNDNVCLSKYVSGKTKEKGEPSLKTVSKPSFDSDDSSLESPMFEEHMSVESPIFKKEDKHSLAQKIIDFKVDVSNLDLSIINADLKNQVNSPVTVKDIKGEIEKIEKTKTDVETESTSDSEKNCQKSPEKMSDSGCSSTTTLTEDSEKYLQSQDSVDEISSTTTNEEKDKERSSPNEFDHLPAFVPVKKSHKIEDSEVSSTNIEIPKKQGGIKVNKSLFSPPRKLKTSQKIKTEQKTPKTEQKTSKTPQKTPKTNQRTPKSPLKTPKMLKSVETAPKIPELGSETTEIGLKTPKTGSKTKEMGSKTPKTSRKSTEMSSKTSEMDSKTPEMDLKTSKTRSKATEMGSKTPKTSTKSTEISSKTPEMDSKTPEMDTKTPEMDMKTSKTRSKATEIGLKTPRTGSKTTEIGLKTPKISSKTTEMGLKTPKTKEIDSKTPETGLKTSKTGSKTTEVGLKTPKTGSKTKEIESETPDTGLETPETGLKTTDIASKTPKTASKTPKMTSKTPKTASKMPKTASKTLEMGSKTSEMVSKTSDVGLNMSETDLKTSETSLKTPKSGKKLSKPAPKLPKSDTKAKLKTDNTKETKKLIKKRSRSLPNVDIENNIFTPKLRSKTIAVIKRPPETVEKVDKTEKSPEKQIKDYKIEFKVGTVVWSRVGTFPYWPSIVTMEPDTKVYTKTSIGRGNKLCYHVNFFGDNGRRSWICSSHMFEYKSPTDLKEKAKTHADKKMGPKHPFHPLAFTINENKKDNWNNAVKEAENIYKVSFKQRVKSFFELLVQEQNKREKEMKEKPKEKRKRESSLEPVAKRIKIDPSPEIKKESDETDDISLTEGISLDDVSLIDRISSRKLKNRTVEALTKRKLRLSDSKKDLKSDDSFTELEIKSDSRSTPSPLAVLSKKKFSLMKGVGKERICHICLKPNKVYRCKGCNESFHIKCDKATITIEYEESSNSTIDSRDSDSTKNDFIHKREGSDTSVLSRKSNQVNLENEEVAFNIKHDINRNSNEVEIKKELDSPDRPKLTLAEQIDMKMLEVMEGLMEKTKYADSTTDDSNSETEDVKIKSEPVETKKVKTETDDKSVTSTPENVKIIKHVTADDVVHKYVDETPKEIHFKCSNCLSGTTPCFVCGKLSSKSGDQKREKCTVFQCGKFYHRECLKDWPQSKWTFMNKKSNKDSHETLVCPNHTCHTCISDDPRGSTSRFTNDKLTKCIRCPTAYHPSNYCLPAGSQILSGTQIICPKHYVRTQRIKKSLHHVNASWCFICSIGGSLICCENCPASFHSECLKLTPPEGSYVCEECESGRLPLYNEIVWVKLGAYRWWPAIILYPSEIPENVRNIKHVSGEFVVRFFGSHDHYWVNRGRVFLFQDGDSGHISSKKSSVDGLFLKAIEEARQAHTSYQSERDNYTAENRVGMKPPAYIKIKFNRPVGNVRTMDANISNTTPCDCNPRGENPCGPDSDCLNRILMTECNPMVCPAGDRCCNQSFEKRLYAPVAPFKTSSRGWGLKSMTPIKKGCFVIEYIGEVIDESEYRRRVGRKHELKDENYYFLTIDKDRMIDAGPKGNVARFMNHSCSPNCETQKWTVNGDTRVGLFAILDIPAEEELTFNYNLECIGEEKKICRCGAPNCSGFIGVKVKQDEKKRKKKKKLPTPVPEIPVEIPSILCFICGKVGAVQACGHKNCDKQYHLDCLKLDCLQEGRWLCPWHSCNICSKRTTRSCYACMNSYCPPHSSGRIRYDSTKYICKEHDKKSPKRKSRGAKTTEMEKTIDDTKIEEKKIEEKKMDETKVEKKLVEAKVEKKVDETKVEGKVEKKVDETKVEGKVEKKIVVTKVEKNVDDTKVEAKVEKKVIETKVERKVAETKVERKVADTKVDKKVAETKVEDIKEEEAKIIDEETKVIGTKLEKTKAETKAEKKMSEDKKKIKVKSVNELNKQSENKETIEKVEEKETKLSKVPSPKTEIKSKTESQTKSPIKKSPKKPLKKIKQTPEVKTDRRTKIDKEHKNAVVKIQKLRKSEIEGIEKIDKPEQEANISDKQTEKVEIKKVTSTPKKLSDANKKNVEPEMKPAEIKVPPQSSSDLFSSDSNLMSEQSDSEPIKKRQKLKIKKQGTRRSSRFLSPDNLDTNNMSFVEPPRVTELRTEETTNTSSDSELETNIKFVKAKKNKVMLKKIASSEDERSDNCEVLDAKKSSIQIEENVFPEEEMKSNINLVDDKTTENIKRKPGRPSKRGGIEEKLDIPSENSQKEVPVVVTTPITATEPKRLKGRPKKVRSVNIDKTDTKTDSKLTETSLNTQDTFKLPIEETKEGSTKKLKKKTKIVAPVSDSGADVSSQEEPTPEKRVLRKSKTGEPDVKSISKAKKKIGKQRKSEIEESSSQEDVVEEYISKKLNRKSLKSEIVTKVMDNKKIEVDVKDLKEIETKSKKTESTEIILKESIETNVEESIEKPKSDDSSDDQDVPGKRILRPRVDPKEPSKSEIKTEIKKPIKEKIKPIIPEIAKRNMKEENAQIEEDLKMIQMSIHELEREKILDKPEEVKEEDTDTEKKRKIEESDEFLTPIAKKPKLAPSSSQAEITTSPRKRGRPKKSETNIKTDINEVKLTSVVPERHLRVVLRKSSELDNRNDNKFVKMQHDIEKDLPIRKRTKLRYEAQM